MSRLQNLILVLWGVVLLLFAAFNWQLIWEPEQIVFLFMDFEFSLLLWLVVSAFAVALVLRLLAGVGNRTNLRKADKEINSIKARAFDGVSGEFDKLVREMKDHVDERIERITSLLSSAPATPPPEPGASAAPAAPPPEQAGGDEGKKEDEWRSLAGAAPAENSAGEAAEAPGAGADDPDSNAGGETEAGEDKKSKGRRKGKT